MKCSLYLAASCLAFASPALAQPLEPAERQTVLQGVDADLVSETALQIWKFAEPGYQEEQSSALLQQQLTEAGFTVTPGIAGEPTAFLASYRNGDGPVVALLAEYDALPGLAQEATPDRAPIAGQWGGHGCGHNLFGAASVGAAMAVKHWMDAAGVRGEIRVYGTPAEEGGSGKVHMVRDGLFEGVDTAIHWHPGNSNSAAQSASKANSTGKFRFAGRSAHASGGPWLGRSALDGLEIMNVATNYLREHVPDHTRIHYVVTGGGGAPNVVPDSAEAFYYVRSPDPQVVKDVMERVKKAAEGAAIATDTSYEFQQVGGVFSLLPNDALGQVMDRNLRSLPRLAWTPEEMSFAQRLQENLEQKVDLASVGEIEPYSVRTDPDSTGGSTDVSDVSWAVPTVGLRVAAFVPGSPGHSWQNAAAAGSSIGTKAAVLAAETMALTAAELMQSPEVIEQAKAELVERRGADFVYTPMIGDTKPQLDYRGAFTGSE